MKTSEAGDLEYKTTDVQNHVIVDLNDHISASDSPIDEVTFVMESDPVNPPFGVYAGKIRVNYPGPTRGYSGDGRCRSLGS